MTESANVSENRVAEILSQVKRLAAEYYQLTGKPLGVTGEVAELATAEKLGLELAPARTTGYDAIRHTPNGPQRIQVKARAFSYATRPTPQKMGAIRHCAECDVVLLVLMDNRTLEPQEMWEAPVAAVEARLAHPGSRARERGVLSVKEFQRLGNCVWRQDRLAA